MRAAAIIAIVLAATSAGAQPRPKITAVDIDAPINPVAEEIVSAALEKVKSEHGAALLIRLNTPGGLLNSTRGIVHSILAAPVPVLVWVAPQGVRAASAGFFLLEAASFAAMAPGTNTGASHPVSATGQTIDGVMKEKVENDAAALMRSIAAQRGRNVQEAEKAVRQSVSWSEREALDAGLIDAVAADTDALLNSSDAKLHLRGATVEWHKPTLRQGVLSAISDPNIALLLFVIGALCVYIEFTVPGMIAPGVAGALLMLLALTAFSMLPIRWLGASLFLLAIVFFILEAKFVSHGVLTTGGAVSMILGALMLVDSSAPGVRIYPSTAIGLTLPFALITSFLLSIAAKARANKVVTGAEGMLNTVGTVTADLNPAGTVLVRGEYWKARSAAPLVRGARVRITGLDGLTLRVEAAAEGESQTK